MPQRSSEHRDPPAKWLRVGTWPDGLFDPLAPETVAYAVNIARALRAALDSAELSVTDVATKAGVQRSTIYDVLGGQVWADTVTLAKLELALEARLWPHDAPPPLARAPTQ